MLAMNKCTTDQARMGFQTRALPQYQVRIGRAGRATITVDRNSLQLNLPWTAMVRWLTTWLKPRVGFKQMVDAIGAAPANDAKTAQATAADRIFIIARP